MPAATEAYDRHAILAAALEVIDQDPGEGENLSEEGQFMLDELSSMLDEGDTPRAVALSELDDADRSDAESADPEAQEIIDRGTTASAAVFAELRQRVRALVKKKSLMTSS